MKALSIAIALTLVKRAEARAELIMSKLAKQRAAHVEVYSSNAGGWN